MFVSRVNQTNLERSFHSHFVTALIGPRQVGKTTLIEHHIEQSKQDSWAIFNMDSLAQRERIEKGGLESAIEEKTLTKIGETKIWVAIDEAQKCPALFDQIKILYDRFKKNQGILKFILTGSATLTLHQLSAETLAGRIELLFLREFGIRETAALKNGISIASPQLIDLLDEQDLVTALNELQSELQPFRQMLTESIQTQLIWGGLPDTITMSQPREKLQYLGNYLQTYLEKDVRDIKTISDLPLYRKLLDILAQQTGSLRDDTKIMQALGCARETLQKYRGYVEATLMYLEIFPHIQSNLKRLVKAPKGYLLNNGLISYLTGLSDLATLEKTGAIGARFENLVLKELQIGLDRDPRRSEVNYWRTSGGSEVDFVLERKPHVYPFEVTYASIAPREKIRHLHAFMQDEPRAKWGFLVYNGEFAIDKENRIFFLPIWLLG